MSVLVSKALRAQILENADRARPAVIENLKKMMTAHAAKAASRRGLSMSPMIHARIDKIVQDLCVAGQ